MSKKIILIISAIILLIVAAVFSYRTFTKEVQLREIRDPAFSVYLENKQKSFEESTDWYEVKIKYPEQNSRASDFIFKQWNDFANESQLKKFKSRAEAAEELGLGDAPEQKYSFIADYKLVEGGTLFGTSTLTYVFTVYTYTGGAHGSTQIQAFTQDEFARVYSVSELLPDDKLEIVSKLAYADLQKQRRSRLESIAPKMTKKEIEEALKDDSWLKEGTSPVRDNYSVVWPDGNNIIISFGQYQIASYAEGIFEVKIPLESLSVK